MAIDCESSDKWGTIGAKVSGYSGICSCSLETVEYPVKKGADCDLRNVREVPVG